MYNIASYFRSAHKTLDVTEVVSSVMAKLTTAGSTADISGELSLFDQERSLVVAKFKTQKTRSAAAAALPTTTGAHAAAAAVEGDPIISA